MELCRLLQKLKDRNQHIIMIVKGLLRLTRMITYTVSYQDFSLKLANLQTKKLEMQEIGRRKDDLGKFRL